MLKRLSISHFKSLENVEIDLDQINVFVGNNASGKTNIVDAVRFIRDSMTNGLDRAISDRHGIESIRQWSPTRPYQISLTVSVENDFIFRGRYHFAIESARGEVKVVHEDAESYEYQEGLVIGGDEPEDDPQTIDYHQKRVFRRDRKGHISLTEWSLGYPADEQSSIDVERFILSPGEYDETPRTREVRAVQPDELAIVGRPLWEFNKLRNYLSSFQAYSIFPNTLRIPQEPSNETYLAPEGRNLASVFKRMRRTQRGTEAINQITEAMQSIMPNLERISVLTVGGFLVPQFHMVERSGKGHIFNVSQLSDGTLRVLGILTALYQVPRPDVIALEEPEQTVNPGILTVLADSIKEVSRGTQILITTHSPNFLDQFKPDLIRTVEFANGRTRVDRVSASQLSVVRDRLFSLGELLVSEGLHG
jgi:predicted ATPase